MGACGPGVTRARGNRIAFNIPPRVRRPTLRQDEDV